MSPCLCPLYADNCFHYNAFWGIARGGQRQAIVSSAPRGKFRARVPDLEGCATSGESLPDAIDQISDAMAAWLCVAEDEGVAIPRPSRQEKIAHKKTDALSLVSADTIKYRARTDSKAARKNVSLPKWLAAFAEKRGLNCSQILQDALLARLDGR